MNLYLLLCRICIEHGVGRMDVIAGVEEKFVRIRAEYYYRANAGGRSRSAASKIFGQDVTTAKHAIESHAKRNNLPIPAALSREPRSIKAKQKEGKRFYTIGGLHRGWIIKDRETGALKRFRTRDEARNYIRGLKLAA